MKNNKTKKRGGENKKPSFNNRPFMARAANSGLLTEAIFTGATLMGRAGRAGFSLAKNASGRLLKSVKPKNASKPNNSKITGNNSAISKPNNSATSKNAPKPNNGNNGKKTPIMP